MEGDEVPEGIREKAEPTRVLSEEEEARILATAPKGTWTLLLIFAALVFGTWAWLFFGVFVSHGTVT